MDFDPREFKKLLKDADSATLFNIKGLVIDEFKSRDIGYKITIELELK